MSLVANRLVFLLELSLSLLLLLLLLSTVPTTTAADRELSSQLECEEEGSMVRACRKEARPSSSFGTQGIAGIVEAAARYGGRRKDTNRSHDSESDSSESHTHQTGGTTKGAMVADPSILALCVAFLLLGLVSGATGWTQGRSRTKEVIRERPFARRISDHQSRGSRTMTESAALAAAAGGDQKYYKVQQEHWNDNMQEEPPGPPSLQDFSDRSFYDTSEAEDEFPELPVRFRSLQELKSDDDDVDDAENSSNLTITKTEIQERDLRHAEELERHVEELENLHRLFEESTQRHNAEIDYMEREFHVESQKREDLLEQALRYAEELEAADRKNFEEQNLENYRLLLELRERDATIERLKTEVVQKDKDLQNSNKPWRSTSLNLRPLRRNSFRNAKN